MVFPKWNSCLLVVLILLVGLGYLCFDTAFYHNATSVFNSTPFTKHSPLAKKLIGRVEEKVKHKRPSKQEKTFPRMNKSAAVSHLDRHLDTHLDTNLDRNLDRNLNRHLHRHMHRRGNKNRDDNSVDINVTDIKNISSIYTSALRGYVFGSIKDTMNPICYQYLPLFIGFDKHHKTGTRFAKDLVSTIRKFCDIGGYYRMPLNFNQRLTQNTKYYDKYKNSINAYVPAYDKNDELVSKYRYFSEYRHWPIYFGNINYYINQYTSQNSIILLNFIRSPLNILISGFKYHLSCPEPWTSCSLSSRRCIFSSPRPCDWSSILTKSTSRTNNNDNHVTVANKKGLLELGDEWIDIYWNNSLYLNDYSNLFLKYPNGSINGCDNVFSFCLAKNNLLRKDSLEAIFYSGITYCRLLRIKETLENKESNIATTLGDRLYFEFVQFYNCQWQNLYVSYFMNDIYKYGYNIRMEDYTASSEKFDQFANDLIFNILGFKFKYENDITENASYNKLMKMLQKNDLNRWNSNQLKSNHHITSKNTQKVAISKEQQIDTLLKYKYTTDNGIVIDVCKNVKRMNLKMGYQWSQEYDVYC